MPSQTPRLPSLIACLFVLVTVATLGPAIAAAAPATGAAGPAEASPPSLAGVFASLPVTPAGDLARVRLLSGNEEAWYARWHLLEAAQKTITSTYFIVDQDVFGFSFLGLLRKKARQGVAVRLMIDDRFLRGAKKWHDYDELQELAREPNVQIRIYNPIERQLLPALLDVRKVLVSNHDKIIIVDDRLCLTGGRNIGRDYFVQMGEHTNVFQDLDVVLEGPGVVQQLQKAFDEEWKALPNRDVKKDPINLVSQSAKLDLAFHLMNRYLNGMGLPDLSRLDLPRGMEKTARTLCDQLAGFKRLSSYASFRLFRGERLKPVRILDRHSLLGTRRDITPNLIRLIDAARREILIQNAYVVLDEAAEAALRRASARGVRIFLCTNSAESTNHQSTVAFFLTDWKRLLATMPTARILVYPKGQPCIHTKAFVFDDEIAVVGTYNLDPLSMVINSEVVTVVADPPFARQLALRMKDDFKKCLEYKIRREPDGRVTVLFGPEDHTQADVMKKLERFGRLKFLRPLI
ncbi:MAG: phosphatidylserine/phosphatidylglycerophosphate/cardiolipin synthase family protein [Candidatus Riflebacteria bacterium]|nr:phosphatidylserine/phosphatidylglycerophosphate/cardiolipin synthase family protein [Candidatus Riflebacteria bacterium]